MPHRSSLTIISSTAALLLRRALSSGSVDSSRMTCSCHQTFTSHYKYKCLYLTTIPNSRFHLKPMPLRPNTPRVVDPHHHHHHHRTPWAAADHLLCHHRLSDIVLSYINNLLVALIVARTVLLTRLKSSSFQYSSWTCGCPVFTGRATTGTTWL